MTKLKQVRKTTQQTKILLMKKPRSEEIQGTAAILWFTIFCLPVGLYAFGSSSSC